MNKQILKSVARGLGVVNVETIDKEQDFVRSIQIAKGHQPCFQSDQKYQCKEYDCEWRSECMKPVAVWMR
ncbi:MAG TPA: hypothetical protein ENJ32_00110 [Crenotrichaceae bacterium]|nr:hypothetical protein [Crenotrichaceae bacterium]